MIEIKEAKGYVGHEYKLYLSKEDAIYSFIDDICYCRSNIVKQREELIELLQLLGDCIGVE